MVVIILLWMLRTVAALPPLDTNDRLTLQMPNSSALGLTKTLRFGALDAYDVSPRQK